MSDIVEIQSDYEYVLGHMIGNVLNLELNFRSMDWVKSELYVIAKELENTARLFATKQGLGTTIVETSVNGNQVLINKKNRTGNLINSIHANVIGNNKIDFFNDAQNSRGEYYAGHIEYGFHDRGGGFVQARPFMRPALFAVSESSQGNLSGTLKRYCEAFMKYGNWNSLTFGHAITTSGTERAFYKDQRPMGRGASSNTGLYTPRGLLNTSRNAGHWFRDIRGNAHYMTVNRRSGGLGQQTFIGRDNRNSIGNTLTRSTRKYGGYTKGTRGRGRPNEGKRTTVKSGRPRGRPATGRKPRPSTGRPVGRPKNGRPSKQPTGRKPGRPKGSKNKKPGKAANPYNHRTIKRNVVSSKRSSEYAGTINAKREAMRESNPSFEKLLTRSKTSSDNRVVSQKKSSNSYGKKSDYGSFKAFLEQHGLSPREGKKYWNKMD